MRFYETCFLSGPYLDVYRTNKSVKLAVASGLRLIVSPTGAKAWKARYSIDNTKSEQAIGAFGKAEGQLTLVQALAKVAAIKAAAKDKRDYPAEEKRAGAKARARGDDMTIADLYAAWHPTIAIKRWRRHGRKDGGAYVEFLGNKHLAPAFECIELRHPTRQTCTPRSRRYPRAVARRWP
ncbi:MULTISPECIES: integrase arm-type DNA-binding domain-containing protein [unclassified Caballeronia]|uniref:integrase arm-type DNA-binding domain-containing protein n=1 Tax=unclassified Caballeronia TaxID=2646786 RepID=UPI00285FF23B|nr:MULTISPECIES: integrase arm-type DNA-binding domain-containing protein [unclassified Caballeronia]MDR5751411.1 integrase arm-type DNA-binding domain-containing protein [Caballeronia sp. LZ024]MDR5844447.1 integrase arm-type DNA-binding domain-containing protein [Caballeronia sp. LZ031]